MLQFMDCSAIVSNTIDYFSWTGKCPLQNQLQVRLPA